MTSTPPQQPQTSASESEGRLVDGSVKEAMEIEAIATSAKSPAGPAPSPQHQDPTASVDSSIMMAVKNDKSHVLAAAPAVS